MNLLDRKPFIIADVGSNFCRGGTDESRLACAIQHIDAAALCGVSAVKFQLYTHRELYGVDGDAPWGLPAAFLPSLADAARRAGVEFMCTPFSPEGIGMVDPFVNVHKLASSEMNHTQMLYRLCRTAKPFIVSTGAATEREVSAVALYLMQRESKFAFLQCVAAYPATSADYNLATLEFLRASDAWRGADYVGVSDHTVDDLVAITAVGAGATIFEKHFDVFNTGQPRKDTPDGAVSIGPPAMKRYCASIRAAVAAMGDGVKKPLPAERDMIQKHKRRLKIIKRVHVGGELRIGENFGIYRSIGVDEKADSPENWEFYEGKRAARELVPSDGLRRTDVECPSPEPGI